MKVNVINDVLVVTLSLEWIVNASNVVSRHTKVTRCLNIGPAGCLFIDMIGHKESVGRLVKSFSLNEDTKTMLEKCRYSNIVYIVKELVHDFTELELQALIEHELEHVRTKFHRKNDVRPKERIAEELRCDSKAAEVTSPLTMHSVLVKSVTNVVDLGMIEGMNSLRGFTREKAIELRLTDVRYKERLDSLLKFNTVV